MSQKNFKTWDDAERRVKIQKKQIHARNKIIREFERRVEAVQNQINNEMRSHIDCYGAGAPALPSLMRIRILVCDHHWIETATRPEGQVRTVCSKCDTFKA